MAVVDRLDGEGEVGGGEVGGDVAGGIAGWKRAGSMV